MVTTGTHSPHQAVIDEVHELAAEYGLENSSVVVWQGSDWRRASPQSFWSASETTTTRMPCRKKGS